MIIRDGTATVKAVEVCQFHSDIRIRIGDEDAERHAYAPATTTLKSGGSIWIREDVMPAINDKLIRATDGECPQCAYLAESQIALSIQNTEANPKHDTGTVEKECTEGCRVAMT